MPAGLGLFQQTDFREEETAPMVLGGITSSLNQGLNIFFRVRLIVRERRKKRGDGIVKMNFNVYMWGEKNGGGVVAHEPESLGTFSICSAHSDVQP